MNLFKLYVLLLNSVLDYDPFFNWMKKMIDGGNSRAPSLPLKFGPLAICISVKTGAIKICSPC